MTSKGGTKQQVTLFYMSQHFGICSPVDVITAITINEKLAWSGNVSSLSSFTIDNAELFGGATKQGGVKGTVYFLPGAADQVLPDNLAVKLGRANGADCPGYRGLASIFMAGPADGQAGFYWTANDPYLPGVWVTVRRAPVGLDPDFALIPRGTGTGLIAISAGTSCVLSWWQAAYDQTLLGDPPGVNDQARMGIGFLDSSGALIGSVTWATLIDPDPPMVFVNRTVSETSPSGAYQVRIYMEMSKRRGVNNDGYIDDISLTVGGIAADIINPGAEAGSTSGWTAEVGGIALRSTSPSPHSGSAYFFGSAFPLARVYQDVYSPIGGLDANPAHMIYECLTNNDWGMGSPSSLIDVASFEAAGEALYLEGLGLSMIWTRQDTIQNFVQEVLDHIQGVLFADPQSGLLTLKLIRGDYNVDALPTISPSTANLSNFGRKLWGDIVNEINVTWTNPTNEQDETVTAHDLASIATQGGIVSDSRNYYGCRYSDLAMRLAMRDLRSAGAPLASCDAEVDRSLWYLQPASVLLVDWPEHGLDGVVMRVTGVDYGKPGDPTIKLSLIEDVFGLDAADYISPPTTLWDEPAAVPTPVDQSLVLTLPYFFAANGITDIASAAYPEVLAGVLAATSNTDTYGYELWSQVTLTDGTNEWESLASLNLVGYGLLSADLAAEAASTGVAFSSYVGTVLPHQAGFAIFGAAVEATSEIALITSATTTFDLSRGVLDTVPKAWAAGSPVWFVTTDALIEDPTARSVAETVDYRLRTRTSKGLLSLSAAPDVTDTLTDRPWRPSRPANVTIGGVQFNTLATPVNMVGASSVPVSWSERDRATEDSVVLAWTAATVAPETGQTTTITVYATDGTTVLATHSGLTGTSFSIPSGSFAGHSVAIVEVASSRTDADGTFVSLQAQRIYVQLTVFAPAADGASGMASVAFTGAALSARALALSGVASTSFSSSNVTGASISSSGAASASLVAMNIAAGSLSSSGAASASLVGSVPVVGAAFDAATKSASVALSNSNFTATKSGTGVGGAKTAYGKKTGKYYFEAVLTNRVVASTDPEKINGVGLARVDTSFAASAIYGFGAIVYVNTSLNGNLWVDRFGAVNLGTPSTGDHYGFAVDLTNGLVWVRRNNGSWNANGSANPATATGGFSLGDLTGYALTPVADFYNNLESLTLATSVSDLVDAAPSGFTSGWPASSPQDNSGSGFTTLLSVKNVSITLSGGDLTATRSAASAIAKSPDSKSEGKQYVEFTLNSLAGADDGVGVCDLDASFTDVAVNGTKCCFIFKSGNIWTGGSTGTSLGALANADVISLAIDWTNLKFWFRRNGGNWNNSGTANPATNTGGIAFVNTTPVPSPGTGNYAGRAMVPAVTFGGTGSTAGNNITLNAGATAFSFTVPSGFESGWDREANP